MNELGLRVDIILLYWLDLHLRNVNIHNIHITFLVLFYQKYHGRLSVFFYPSSLNVRVPKIIRTGLNEFNTTLSPFLLTFDLYSCSLILVDVTIGPSGSRYQRPVRLLPGIIIIITSLWNQSWFSFGLLVTCYLMSSFISGKCQLHLNIVCVHVSRTSNW